MEALLDGRPPTENCNDDVPQILGYPTIQRLTDLCGPPYRKKGFSQLCRGASVREI
jgi:hypothetical protein